MSKLASYVPVTWIAAADVEEDPTGEEADEGAETGSVGDAATM
ncbi:MAG: hypothetical protein ACXWNI_06840 [Candidatus Limnocylindrales bacterium]